ncbi:MAG: Nickel and cobalt resistance protein CnrB, partial [Pseudomonadota bacterium]
MTSNDLDIANRERGRVMKKRGVWASACNGLWTVLGVSFGLSLGWGSASVALAQEANKPPTAKPSLTVTVATPQVANMAQKISANGSLAAWQEAVVGAEANGLKITEVRVNVGDRVQRGDVLALLQSDTLAAELAQAEAGLAEATANAAEAKAQAERARNLQQ